MVKALLGTGRFPTRAATLGRLSLGGGKCQPPTRRVAKEVPRLWTHAYRPGLGFGGLAYSRHQRATRKASHPGGGLPLPGALANRVGLQTAQEHLPVGCLTEPKLLPGPM